jgi:hypothetical protein
VTHITAAPPTKYPSPSEIQFNLQKFSISTLVDLNPEEAGVSVNQNYLHTLCIRALQHGLQPNNPHWAVHID